MEHGDGGKTRQTEAEHGAADRRAKKGKHTADGSGTKERRTQQRWTRKREPPTSQRTWLHRKPNRAHPQTHPERQKKSRGTETEWILFGYFLARLCVYRLIGRFTRTARFRPGQRHNAKRFEFESLQTLWGNCPTKRFSLERSSRHQARTPRS